MTATAVLGLQWGDEGKGKIVHLMSEQADWCVRFNGGTNAGHRVVVDRVQLTTNGHSRRSPEAFAFHLVPSGALNATCKGVLGNGMVVDPYALSEEMALLSRAKGASDPGLYFSQSAHLLMPYHPIVERMAGSTSELDTTAKGIGPAYRDKVKRRGVRLGDLHFPETFFEKVKRTLDWERKVWGDEPFKALNTRQMCDEIMALARPWLERITDTGALLNAAIDRGESVMFEGAQACLLDLDYGTYPFVTSSSATVGGVGVGAGVSPRRLGRVVGVSKAYTTRVGAGPFPSEDEGQSGERLRDAGHEYGTTTGRPRRCGWLDLVALRYACRVNDLTEIALTKLDVLSGFEQLKVVVAYELEGRRLDEFPCMPEVLVQCRPVYETLPGWSEHIGACRSLDDLPQAAKNYVNFIEEAVRYPVGLISVGPGFAENVVVR